MEPAFLAMRGSHLTDRLSYGVRCQVSTVHREVVPRKFHMPAMAEALTPDENLVQNPAVLVVHGVSLTGDWRAECSRISAPFH